MAITLIAKPEEISPAYNPLRFIMDSNNVNNEGFKYVFEVYDSTSTKIAEYKVLPNLVGYGELDLSKLLQGYVSYDFNPLSTGYVGTNSSFEYDLEVGEEYVTVINWTSNLVDNGGSVQIVATHAFQIGDQVSVDGGVDNPNITGLWTVTDISTTVNFTISAAWSLVDDATGNGSVRYADNRKTIDRGLYTTTQFVYNGAIPFANFNSYVDDEYLLDDANAKFLTSMPRQDMVITTDQDIWMHMLTNGNNTGRMVFTNDTGDVAYRLIPETGLTAFHQVAGDFTGLVFTTGSSPLVKPTTKYYDFYFYQGSIKSRTYRFYIDDRCKINDYEIAFVDRLGTVGSFAFQLREKLTGTVKKETYNQRINGKVVSNKWTYDSFDKGMKVINPSIEEVYELNTNWMNEDMAAYFTELVSSPQTWLKIGTAYYSCIVEDTGFEKERQKNRNLIRKTIRVKLSVQDRING